MRKPNFNKCENKDSDQLWGNCKAIKLQIVAKLSNIQIVQSLLSELPASSYLLCFHRSFDTELVVNSEDRFSSLWLILLISSKPVPVYSLKQQEHFENDWMND